MIDDDSVMLVTNHGPQPFKFGYGGREYVVRPNTRGTMVPWSAVKLHLGDPFLMDRVDAKGNEDRARTDELSRINFRFGMLDRPFYSDDPAAKTGEYADARHILPDSAQPRPYVRTDSRAEYGHIPAPGSETYRHPNLPWLHVYDMADGENRRVWMIVDDPNNVAEYARTTAENQSSVDATAAEMADLRRRLIELERAQSLNLAAEPLAAPTPTPTPAPVGASVAVDPLEGRPFVGGDDLTEAAGIDPLGEIDAPFVDSSPVDLAAIDPLDSDLTEAFTAPAPSPSARPAAAASKRTRSKAGA